MKKNKIGILRIGLLSFVFAFIIYACNKDDVSIPIEIPQESKVKRIKLDVFNNKVSKNQSYTKLESYFDINTVSDTNLSDRSSLDSNILILTDEIILVQEEFVDFYTFKVFTDTQGDEFYNLVVQLNKQGEIIKSEFLEYQPSLEYLADTSLPFRGYVKLIENDFLSLDNLLSREFRRCVKDVTKENVCTGGWESVPNPPGIECQGWEEVLVIHWEACPAIIDAGDSGGAGFPIDDGEDNGGGGNDGGGTSTVPTKPCDVGTSTLEADNGDCLEELGKRKECKKIIDFINAPENQAFKNKLTELSQQPNLNLNKEKSVSSFENEVVLDERIGTENSPSVAIQSNPTNKYKAFVHTHPNIGDGTYSVFSLDDLIEIARIINNEKVTNGFVAFLTTKKGTQYALTINDPTKFVDFFYYELFDNLVDVPDDSWIRYLVSKNKFLNLNHKYFNPNTDPKIKETDTDNENVLKEFLNFMDEADTGFTLFDASSTTFGEPPFTSFRRIRLKNGAVERDYTCN